MYRIYKKTEFIFFKIMTYIIPLFFVISVLFTGIVYGQDMQNKIDTTVNGEAQAVFTEKTQC